MNLFHIIEKDINISVNNIWIHISLWHFVMDLFFIKHSCGPFRDKESSPNIQVENIIPILCFNPVNGLDMMDSNNVDNHMRENVFLYKLSKEIQNLTFISDICGD